MKNCFEGQMINSSDSLRVFYRVGVFKLVMGYLLNNTEISAVDVLLPQKDVQDCRVILFHHVLLLMMLSNLY